MALFRATLEQRHHHQDGLQRHPQRPWPHPARCDEVDQMTAPTAVFSLMAALWSSALQPAVSYGTQEPPCANAHETVNSTLHDISPTGTRAVRKGIDDANILFRMHRKKEATAALEAALAWFGTTRNRLTTTAERDSVRTAVDRLRQCIAASTAPAQATLTVRTYVEDDRVADGKGPPAAPGALVRVDGMAIGRTKAGGIFTGRVPSGSLRVTAEVPPSEAGGTEVDLRRGAARAVSIVLQSSKEVTEETPLVVAEADGGVLSASARALTLKFVGASGTVRIRTIDEIDLLGSEDNREADLTRMFKVEGGAMVAVDPAKVIETIRARRYGLVVLSVQASDQTTIHASRVEFRIE
jgi:hypothetical protein